MNDPSQAKPTTTRLEDIDDTVDDVAPPILVGAQSDLTSVSPGQPQERRRGEISSRAVGSLADEYEFGQRRRDDEQRCFLVHQLGADPDDRYRGRSKKPRRPLAADPSSDVQLGHAADLDQADATHSRVTHPDVRETVDGIINTEDDVLAELRLLADSAGAVIVGEMIARSRRLDPATFIGSGKVEELGQDVARLDVDLVIIDHDISPIQERNLELKLKCRVLGRTGLILDIFARRAATHEGKMQVELAQLSYLSTRLVRGWSHLERQKGGIGLRGPGETQLELDRRMLATRVRSLNGKLTKVEAQRALRRRSRARAALPTLSLVGYTNAGKSSLFNALTEGNAQVADQLFKTLDPVMRKSELPQFGTAVFSDTVGFIRQLPHDLVTAFHSTLEEVANAQLLLHVVDDASAERDELIAHVNSVLKEIGADEVPVVMVYNKVDVSGGQAGVVQHSDTPPNAVRVSAHTGAGVEDLKLLLSQVLGEGRRALTLCGGVTHGKVRAQIYARMTVVDEKADEDGEWRLSVLASAADRGWLKQQVERFTDLRMIETAAPSV